MAKLKDGTRIYGNANVNATLTTVDLVVTGNISIQGTTTTIDTATTRIEDPLMELGGGPEGNALTTDDGLERGLLMHYYAGSGVRDAYMGWNTSAGEFSLASNVTYSGNNITTINEYGNVQAFHFKGEGDTLGNITGANVTGIVTSANMAAYAANVTNASQPNITSLGTLTGLVVGNANANTTFGNGTFTTTGTANVANLIVTGSANIGNLKVDGTITGNFTGSTSAPGANTQVVFNDAGTSNATAGFTFTKSSNAVTVVGTITGGNLSTDGTLSVTGNANIGNIGTGGLIVATGNITGGNLVTGGVLSVTGNANVGNLGTGGLIVATGNVTGGNLTTAGDVTTVTLTASGNISTTANLSVTQNANITGIANAAGGFATGANIDGTGSSSSLNIKYIEATGTANITSTLTAGNLSTAGTADVTGNATVGNLSTVGRATVGNLTMSTGALVTGNLIPSANVTYDLGNATNAWKDLWLSGDSIRLGSQTITSNSSGVNLSNSINTTNITASNLISTVTLAASGAITGANVTANNLSNTQVAFANGSKIVGDANLTFTSTTGTLSANLFTGTLTTNAQPNITSVGTLSGLTVTANIVGNIAGFAYTVANGAQANITSVGTLDSLMVAGNIQSNANVITDNILAKGTGNLTVTAGSTNGNIVLAPTGTGTVDVSSKRITGLATPTQASDAATKGYVDASSQGLDIKNSVRVATTTNITLSGAQTIDGVSAVAGNRVLVKNQTNANQNGIYVVAAGTWTRATDADDNGELTAGSFTFVEEGDTYNDTGWVISTNGEIVIGTDPMNWTQFSGSGSYSAADGVQLIGSVFSAKVDDSTINVVSGSLHVKDGLTLVTPNIGAATGTSLDLGTGNITAGNAIIGAGSGGSITGANLLSANFFAGTLTTAAQPNITSVGTLANLTVTANTNLNGNVYISNATAGNGIFSDNYYYANGVAIDFQTAAGDATEIQFKATGSNNLAASNNFTFNATSNTLSVTGTANVSGTVTAGNLKTASLTSTRVTFATTGGQLTDNANLTFSGTELTVTGTANVSGQAIVGNLKTDSLTTGRVTFQGAGNVLADDAQLTFDTLTNELQSGNANVAGYMTAGNVTARNLTTAGRIVIAGSAGLLSDNANLSFDTTNKTLSVDNANVSNTVTAGYFSGNGSSLTQLTGSEVTGQVANALVAGTVYTNAQPNITSTGTLTGLTVSGQTNLGAIGNITITGGSSGYALTTDGSGVLSWASTGASTISNGNSDVTIPGLNGNIQLKSGGNLVLTVTGVGANITGTLDVTGNISGNNISAANTITANANTDSTSSVTGTVKVTGGMAATGNIYTGQSVGFANNNGGNTSKAYIQFNETANSLDFIFN